MAGLSQLELDALCVGADAAADGASSPQGSLLRRRRRRVPLSAMAVEITALEDAENECSFGRPGLSQKELDELNVGGEDSGLHCSSPASSRIYRAKRSALPCSKAMLPHSVAGMSPGHEEEKTGTGLSFRTDRFVQCNKSQEELDAICFSYAKIGASVAFPEGLTANQEQDMKRSTLDNDVSLCRSPASSKKRNRRIPTKENPNWCFHTDENASPSSRANSKELSQVSPIGPQNMPQSPLQQRKCHSTPLSPLKWQSN
eukprot:TRINITY_DN43077_c0_g1_i1.p1 TRINITY_DN43077_c0_g1~~TRINITY_DN43077_c0_g1_i1.p1  ORF type:complete len:284 (-),score=38.67 TRINITY_DN43077_c0_g1_i1:41-814(-)